MKTQLSTFYLVSEQTQILKHEELLLVTATTNVYGRRRYKNFRIS